MMHPTRRPWRPLLALGIGLGLLPALAGCGRSPKGMSGETALELTEEERGKVVARIGDTRITLEDFERRLNQQSPFARSRYNSLARKQEFLETLVRFELLALEAKARGHDQDPDVQLAHKQALVRALTAREVAELVKMDEITEADIAAWYSAHKDEFIKPAELRAAHILLPDETAAKGLLADLQAQIAKAPEAALERFAERARQASTDAATAEQGGDLGWFGVPGEGRVERGPAEPQVPPPVARAAAALAETGALHPEPLRSSQGWHVVQRTGHRRAFERSLDDVRTRIRNQLFRARKAEALEAYVARLRTQAKVTIDEAVLAEAKLDPQGGFDPRIAPPHLRPDGPGPQALPVPKAPGALPAPRAMPRAAPAPGADPAPRADPAPGAPEEARP